MAKVMIGHHPELTGEDAMKILQGHLGGKYDIYKSKRPHVDFMVKKSAWQGVTVKLRQKRKETAFVINGVPGSAIMATLFPLVWLLGTISMFSGGGGGAGAFVAWILWTTLILWLPSRPSKGLEKEVRGIIEKAEEFKEDSQKFESKNNT